MNRKYLPNLLRVGSWNIEGIFEKVNGITQCKMHDETFIRTVQKFDIICIQETHVSETQPLPEIKDFYAIPHCRKVSSNNRYFGFFLVLLRKTIKNGIKTGINVDKDCFEIILQKTFFGIENDIKILFTYASPINSCYSKCRDQNILDKIDKKVSFDDTENLILMGDLNGRTNLADDFVRDEDDKHSPINNLIYKKDIQISRNNQDLKPVDQQGKFILEYCKNTSSKILNGRTPGDQTGQFTRYPTKKGDMPSVIDYSICGSKVIDKIQSFSVLAFSDLSDHCCISTSIRVNRVDGTIVEENNNKIHPRTVKYTFDKRYEKRFEESMTSDPNLTALHAKLLQNVNPTQNDINEYILNLNSVILDAAKRCAFAKKLSKNKHCGKNGEKSGWYNNSCKALRTKLRLCCKKLSKEPFNRTLHDQFLKARSEYKKECRNSEKMFRRHLTVKLNELGNNDPISFWKIIKSMNNWGKLKNNPEDTISPHIWWKHFKELLTGEDPGPLNNTPIISIATFDPLLDGIITKKELEEAVRKLKRGKAVGPDGILSEYLISFHKVSAKTLLKLLNSIFSNSLFPEAWSQNYMKPIFKKGTVTLPDNYRGLAISSNFAKLFSLILLARLNSLVEKHKMISNNQIGFMKGSRTSDHIFLLQTIVDKVVKKANGRLYTAFIDFKKAYDTVDRKILFERLQTLGINGIFLGNLKSLYGKTKYRITYKDGYLDAIESTIGLKQGCPLSPILFNLYIDDIKDTFDDRCDPVSIDSSPLNHILYADDLVLISHTKKGLQRCIDKLSAFADRKRIKISHTKSKIMIFNKTGRSIKEEFKVNNQKLETVKSFCYLGYDFNASGSLTNTINILADKAIKAMRPIQNVIARFCLPAKLSIRLFNTYVTPIILYNVENWAILSHKTIQDFSINTFMSKVNESKASIIQRRFLKYILGLTKSCPNLAVMGETNEIPLMLKGYTQMLKYWYRVSNLSNENLAKKALIENIALRSNWICTVEKILNLLNLTNYTDSANKFQINVKKNTQVIFNAWWNDIISSDSGRLNFYNTVKKELYFEEYINLPNFHIRKAIAQIRCSDHVLEIEKGRHKKIPRAYRLCKLCDKRVIESEVHFLVECDFYDDIKKLSGTTHTLLNLFSTENLDKLGKFIVLSFNKRQRFFDDVGTENIT